MTVRNIVPVIAVRDIAKAKEFYQRVFGFDVVHANQWYVHLRANGDQKLEIGFVASNHPSQPPVFQSVFDGKGVFYSVEVDDVDEEYRRLKALSVRIRLEPMDEPWGERHFAFEDPNGVIINVSKTDPAKRNSVSFEEHMSAKEKKAR